MIKYLLNKALISMSKRYDYDVRYMQDILEEDFAAFLKFMGFQTMSSHCGGLPKEAVYAARLGSIMWDDCGPCTQLIINMALENKVNPNHLRAIINKDLKALPDSTALVVRFTELVLSHDPEADELRKEIQTLWGKKGVIAIGFCISSSRVYPAFKYAMGYGMVCNQIQLNDVSLIPDPKSTNNFKANDV